MTAKLAQVESKYESFVTPVLGSMTYMVTDIEGPGASLVTILDNWVISRQFYPKYQGFHAMHSSTMKAALADPLHPHYFRAMDLFSMMEVIAGYYGATIERTDV